MPMSKAELAHLDGAEVVVIYVYQDGAGTQTLAGETSPELQAWQEAAFTNGPPLTEIRIRWDPKAAAELRKVEAD